MRLNLLPAFLLSLAILALTPSLRAAEPKPPKTAKPLTENETLALQLAAKDPPAQHTAMLRIRALISEDPKQAASAIRKPWMQAAINGGLYAEADELALTAILIQPQHMGTIVECQKIRVRAFLAAGNPAEALKQAKSLFNVVNMSDTAEAILLVADCLKASDPALAERFREEQIAAAAPSTRPVTAVNAYHPDASFKTSSILASIRIDPKPYEKYTEMGGNDPTARGNLLLLADKPAEAKAVFEHIYSVAPEKQLAAVTENLARVIKAEDGTIGRANAWILSLRPAVPAPAPAGSTTQPAIEGDEDPM